MNQTGRRPSALTGPDFVRIKPPALEGFQAASRGSQMSEPPFRGYHDIGGMPAGPIQQDEHPFADWQKLSEALRGALQQEHGCVSLDEIRRAFESFGEPLYETLGFYERRAEALTLLLDEKNLVRRAEVLARMDALAAGRGQRVDHAAKTVTEL